ncbi:DUF4761 family protein [Serratia ureilytica]|uniref:DUF4761 family protein n=1 Tax=Serratia ureilytica TaxID=300181 RepID=UPI00370FB562
MKKRHSKHGSHAGSIPGLVQVGKNVYVHTAGFTIRRSPRNFFKRDSYLINKWDDEGGVDNYYGRDFSLVEAKKTIDRLKSGKRYES